MEHVGKFLRICTLETSVDEVKSKRGVVLGTPDHSILVTTMPSNKPRLYLALYARSKHPDSYHYALHVSPKETPSSLESYTTTKYHCKNIIERDANGKVHTPWAYESTLIKLTTEPRLLVRVLLGKVHNESKLRDAFSQVPVVQRDKKFNCVEWVRLALQAVAGREGDMMEDSWKVDWEPLRKTAVEFVERLKKQGRWDVGYTGDTALPTIDTDGRMIIVDVPSVFRLRNATPKP